MLYIKTKVSKKLLKTQGVKLSFGIFICINSFIANKAVVNNYSRDVAVIYIILHVDKISPLLISLNLSPIVGLYTWPKYTFVHSKLYS